MIAFEPTEQGRQETYCLGRVAGRKREEAEVKVEVYLVLTKGTISTNDKEIRNGEVRYVTMGCVRGCAEIAKDSGGL